MSPSTERTPSTLRTPGDQVFGAGIPAGEQAARGGSASEGAHEVDGPESVADAPSPAPPARGTSPGNRIGGVDVGSVTGHDFRTAEGDLWPRSGARDVAAALGCFAGRQPGPQLSRSGAAAAVEALVLALADDDELHADVGEALGSVRESAHFSVTRELVLAALSELDRIPRDENVPDGGDTALALHWSEPFAAAAARAIRAATTARCVLIVTDPRIPRLGLTLAAGLENAGVDPRRIAVLHDDGSDVLRALAAEPELTLDVVRPDAFATGLVASLSSIRDARRGELLADDARQDVQQEAQQEVSAAGAARAADVALDWFGLGVVDRPSAPLNVRMAAGLDLVIGDVEVASHPRAQSQSHARAVHLSADDLVEAAEEVVERAFGRGVLGGYAADAVARVFVERHAFSRFTEYLLEVLEDADGDPWFDPPAWAYSAAGRVGPALFTARRIGLDEDGTLVYERRRRRRRAEGREGDSRRRGGAEPHGLVFTNIERRMRLGGALRVSGVLALVRGGRGPAS